MPCIFKYIAICFFCLFCACSNSQTPNHSMQKNNKISTDRFIEINKQFIENDQNVIAGYVDTMGMVMDRTETGLWYSILEKGEGENISTGQIVTLDYQISLLDGTLCYSSDSLGYKTFMTGHGGVETGLEEGVLMLKKGSKATFIMAPHLAHGLIGDDDKIPYRAILLYEVEVIDVKEK